MPHLENIGKLILRLVVGGLMLPHGMSKFSGEALGGIQGALTGNGLPEFMAYGVYVGEVLAPILVLLGYFTRPAAAVMAFNMVVAVGLAHRGQILMMGEHGGHALELQALYLFGAVAIALLGAGRYSISGGEGKWD